MRLSRQRRVLVAALSGCLVLAMGVLVALIVNPSAPRMSARAVGAPWPPASAERSGGERREGTKGQERPAAAGAQTEPRASNQDAQPSAPAPPPARASTGRGAATSRGAAPPTPAKTGPTRTSEPARPVEKPPAPPSASSQGKGVVRMEMKSGSDVKTMGSGFIVSVAGYVVTNYSIVDAAGGVKNLEMKLPTGETVKVKQVISTDQELDLAVLAFEPAKNMSAVGLVHVDVRAGEKVTIVSSPAEIKGLKTLPDGRQLIEMTAPISVTSSGGPVFNSAGQIVCVVVAKVRNAEGQRYCVPIRDVIPNLEGVPDVQIATTK